MTAAPATTTAATSLQTPPASHDPIFSQGLPNPAYQTSAVAQEHRAKRRRVGYVYRGYRKPRDCYILLGILYTDDFASDAFLASATQRLETYLQVLGGDDLIASSVELPRLQLLREACQQGDLFFVALHQLFCFWSMNPQDFNTHYAQNEATLLESAFGLLSSILKSNSSIRQQHLAWLSQFPAPLHTVSRDSEYADTINGVLQFLRRLARFWSFDSHEHMRIGYPYLVDELLLKYRLYSEVLQTVIFRASRRAMGVPDGAAGTRMDQLFHSDLKRHRSIADGKTWVKADYLSDSANIALIGSYQTIVRQARNQGSGSAYATAPITSNGFRTQQQQTQPERPYSHQQQAPYMRHGPSAYPQPPAQQQPHSPSVQQLYFGQQQQQQRAYQQPNQTRPPQHHTTVSPTARFIPQFSATAATPTGAPQQANRPSTSSPSNPNAGALFARPSNGINAPIENDANYFTSASPQSQQPANGNGQPTYASPLQSPIGSRAHPGAIQQAQEFRQPTQTMPQQFQRNPVLRRPSLQSHPGTLPLSPQLQHLSVASPRMPDGGVSPANPGGGFRPQQHPPQGRSSPIYPSQQRAPPTNPNTTLAPSPTMNVQSYRPMTPARQPNMAQQQQQPGQPFVFTGGAGAGPAGQIRPSNVRAQTAVDSRVRPSNSAAGTPGSISTVPRVIPPIQVADYPHDPYERRSLVSSLHQADIRSPTRQPHQVASGSPERHYQYITYLALEPSAIPPQQALYNFNFSVPEEVRATISKTECPVDGLPVNTFSDKSKRIRLRCVFRPKTASRFVEGEWVVADTQWPEHIFIKLNQITLTIQRKQQHAKDQPIEVGHYITAGANALQLFVSDGQGKASKNLVPFIAVEVIETMSHSSIMGLPNLAANAVIPAADTVAIIKRRLGGTSGNGNDDDDIAMVVSDLTVNLADPFSFCIFGVPARGKDCTHLECFDLETWLTTRPAKKSCTCGSHLSNCGVCPKEPSLVDKWKCPLCSGDARPQNLRIDGFLQQVREALATQGKLRTKEILVSADGSWRPKTDPADDPSDDDSEAEAPPAALRSRSTTRPSEQRTPVVIELLD